MTWLRIAVVALAFAIAAVAMVPLGSVLAIAPLRDPRIDPGFSSGTVWSGRLEGVKWENTPLGDFKVATSPMALLTGMLRVRFSSSGPVRKGEWLAGPSGERFEKLTGLIELSQLSSGAPPGAFISFLDTSAEFTPSGCRKINGRVLVDGLADAGFQAMEGTLACEAGRVVIVLASADTPPLDLIVDTKAGTLTARSQDPATLAALTAIGIAIEPAGTQ